MDRRNEFRNPQLSDRRGSTILVVMALMGMLATIGFLFYTFSAQERSNANYFADGHKNTSTGLDPDTLWDWALEQLIVGPPRLQLRQNNTNYSLGDTIYYSSDSPLTIIGSSTLAYRCIQAGTTGGSPPTSFSQTIGNWTTDGSVIWQTVSSLAESALTGSRHSLVPTVVGTNLHPYNSAGIHLGSNNGLPFVDQDYDGQQDAANATTPYGQTLLQINHSLAANGGVPRNLAATSTLPGWPDPGVDYTYPDINNVYLSYTGTSMDSLGGNQTQVIIPSFHRPQLLRTTSGAPITNWQTVAQTSAQVLRPHPSHTLADGATPMYFTSANVSLGITSAFPFQPGGNAQGVWDWTSTTSLGSTPSYQWDVDNDGDGTNEGVWLNLGFPIQRTATGKKYVPLFSFTVVDADALFNVNAHGNMNALTDVVRHFAQLGSSTTLAATMGSQSGTALLSTSNQGMTSAEVNPEYGLAIAANAFSGTSTQAYGQWVNRYGLSASPANWQQVANLEWLQAVTGAVVYQTASSTPIDLFAGRNGEQSGLLQVSPMSALNPAALPQAGQSFADDNLNQYEGAFNWETASGYTPSYSGYYAPLPNGQPLDYDGDGRTTSPGSLGRTRLLTSTLGNGMPTPYYSNFDNPGGVNGFTKYTNSNPVNTSSVGAGWLATLNTGGLMLDGYGTAQLPGTLPLTQRDEPTEAILDRTHSSPYDAIFGMDENFTLQGSPTDLASTNVTSRLKSAMSWSLSEVGSGIASATGKRFTTDSWDRKEPGFAIQQSRYLNWLNNPANDATFPRPWEITNTKSNPTLASSLPTWWATNTFPPLFGAATTPASGTTGNISATSTFGADPFRPAVRRALEILAYTNSSNYRTLDPNQVRLNINQRIVRVNSAGNELLTGVNESDLTTAAAGLAYRNLTPHDSDGTLSNTAIGTNTSAAEYRARLDRQQMARDVYVLLYLTGGGCDLGSQNGPAGGPMGNTAALNYNTYQGYLGDNSTRNIYTDLQLREMAQFAVNLVDAIDPDNIATKFEYDKNLFYGWRLDDNAYTADSFATAYTSGDTDYNALYPEDGKDRGVVYGVEQAELTLSEALVFQASQTKDSGGTIADHPATEYDESQSPRYFTYLELRNIGNNAVDLATQAWSIKVYLYDTSDRTAPTKYRRLVLQRNGDSGSDLLTVSNASTYPGIQPGQLVLLANMGESSTSATTQYKKTHFFCDPTWTTGTPDFTKAYTWVAPGARLAAYSNPVSSWTSWSTSQENPKITNSNQSSLTEVKPDFDLIAYQSGGSLSGTPPFTLVDESGTAISNNVSGFLNLDLLTTKFNLTSMDGNTDPTTTKLVFQLERRQYPNRQAVTLGNTSQEADNPWVPVDQMVVPIGWFNLQNTGSSNIGPQLKNVQSRERSEPLASKGAALDAVHPSATIGTDTQATIDQRTRVTVDQTSLAGKEAAVFSTLKSANSNSPYNGGSPAQVQFTLYQSLFNRPLASPIEMFQIPLYAPLDLTRLASVATYDVVTQYTKSTSGLTAASFATTAGAKILCPEHPYNTTQSTKLPYLDNRWYRLLEFYGVPNRWHRQVQLFANDPNALVRVPGKVNLNMLRHPEVLAGLVDDPDIVSFTPNLTMSSLVDQSRTADTSINAFPVNSDWYKQLLKSRDGRPGYGTTANEKQADSTTGLYLPGLADSSPMRGLGASNLTYSSTGTATQSPNTLLEQSILRRLPADLYTSPNNTDPRNFWEVGQYAVDHQGGGGGTTSIDPSLRHRLLSKVFNNTTTRSGVFFVFISVGYFEADDSLGNNNIRIGGYLNPYSSSNPAAHRGFFVVDRSQLERGFDPTTGKFNFRSFVGYRKTIK